MSNRSHPSSSTGSPRVSGPTYRFTVLTSRLIRMEHSESGVFVDDPSQLALCRDLESPGYEVADTADLLEIFTEHLHLRYDKRAFSPGGLTVTLRSRAQEAHVTTWRHGVGASGNLGGTARTLDEIDGRTDMGQGLLSTNGFAVIDDSASLLLTQEGWVRPRPQGSGQDLYFFGYGHDYPGALRDFFRLSGPTPLLPRYALGNWWSRYRAYSDEEYLGLMDGFAQAGIPFSVAVLDMDWHLVDIDPTLGSGWTGYTWNRELFADPEHFLAELHRRNLRVTLNVHPADGVRAHEEAYTAMAQDLGLDPHEGHAISFEVTSRTFIESYLRHLHHPHEEIGVDFWWLDWQSGHHSRMPGLDPLWMLNHVHFHDSARNGRRPLTFSRYAGIGSHRYPVGFSGDTVVSWDSLRFQPEFTATAANVGYFWWSHDIGGHFRGIDDPELATRWFQLGTFSPINRLHSTNSIFGSKEPQRFPTEHQRAMTTALRLRHRLLPYLYTMNWQAHSEGIPPVRPLYHEYPESPEAYEEAREFLFGPSLLVAPVNDPIDPITRLARTSAWLPPGTWYDLATGRRYLGGTTGRRVALHRDLHQYPVLARAGAILPLAADPMADVETNPASLRIVLHAGDDGEFTLVEDDGRGTVTASQRQETPMRWTWQATTARFTIEPPTGPGVLTHRELTLEIVGITEGSASVRDTHGTRRAGLNPTHDRTGTLVIDLGGVDLREGLEIELTDLVEARNEVEREVFDLLNHASLPLETKEAVMHAVESLGGGSLAASLQILGSDGHLLSAILELTSAEEG